MAMLLLPFEADDDESVGADKDGDALHVAEGVAGEGAEGPVT